MTRSNAVVLITGASSGFGQAMAQLLSERGYVVYGTSRKAAGDDALPYTMLRMDVTDSASVGDGIQQVMERENRIDVLINNAGIGVAGAFEDTSIEEAKRQFETNFFGIVRVTQEVLPHMRQRKTGMIINISSIGGLVGLPFQGFYSASKFAIEGLTESLRLEVAPFNIRVTNINPGDFHTRFTDNRVVTQKALEGAYSDRFKQVLAIYEEDEIKGAKPAVLAERVEKVIRKKSPKVRYLTGMLSQRIVTVLKPLMGSKGFELLMKGHYKIR